MQHCATLRPFSAGAALQRVQRRPAQAAGGNGASVVAELAEGTKIKVKAPIKVFHSPKFKTGLDLQGMEGVVVQPNVNNYKHHDGKQHTLSANLPVRIEFTVPPPNGKGKDVKVVAHMEDEEFEVL